MVNIRPAKVLRPPQTEIKSLAHTEETPHVNKTEAQIGLDLRPRAKNSCKRAPSKHPENIQICLLSS